MTDEFFNDSILNGISEVDGVIYYKFPETLYSALGQSDNFKKLIEQHNNKTIIVLTSNFMMLNFFPKELVTVINNYVMKPCKLRTLHSNLHSLYYNFYRHSNLFKETKKINEIITKVNAKTVLTPVEDQIVNAIGEPVIRNKIFEMQNKPYQRGDDDFGGDEPEE